MIKAGDKSSIDQPQQKLRQDKKQWNKGVSAFIDNLIHYKKLINGQPNKFLKEKSTIKDPIPADPAGILSSLVNSFQELSSSGNAIIAAQLEYSKTRKKKSPKLLDSARSPGFTEPLNLTKQLAFFEQKYDLVAEGSSSFSRFFTKLFNPTFGWGNKADLRRARMSMLTYANNAHKNLEDFQVLIVKSSKESITDANKKLYEAKNNWDLVSRAYAIYKSSKSVKAVDKGGIIENEKDKPINDDTKNVDAPATNTSQIDEDDEVDSNVATNFILEMSNDYRNFHGQLPSMVLNEAATYLRKLDTAVDKLISSRGKKIDPNFVKIYEAAINSLNQELNTTGKSFKDIVSQLNNLTSTSVPPIKGKQNFTQLEKVSQKFLKKWLGKNIHQMSLFDDTSTHRLQAYDIAEDMRIELNEIMNLLETGLDEDKLDPLIKSVNSKLITIRGVLRSLYLVGKK